MKIIDMHCDTLLECYQQGYDLRNNSGHLDLLKMKDMDGLAQFFAIYLSADGNDSYERFQHIYQMYISEMEMNRDMIEPALCYKDIVSNSQGNKMSSILTVEDGQLLDNRIHRVKELYDKGVRLITLLWCEENCIGYPDSFDPSIHGKGLKPFGLQVVEEMNSLGMIIDVSHMSAGGFADVVKYSKKPFVASHSCARSLCDHSRNLTDQQLKCISENGGVAGVNFYSQFLREGCDFTRVSDILSHIDYMINVMGAEAVALGSDFDGIDCQMEMKDYGQYNKLILELERRYPIEVVEKICYKNILRVLKECC